MQADVPQRTREQKLTSKELAVVAFVGTTVVTAAVWLWAVTAAPAGGKGLMAALGAGSTLLLACAAGAAAYYAATGRELRRQARWAESRYMWLRQENVRVAEEALPVLGRRVREGVPVVDAFAQVPSFGESSLQRVLRAAGNELGVLQRELDTARKARESAESGARAAREALEQEISRLSSDTLPELVRRLQKDRMSVGAALADMPQPEHDPLRDLLGETAQHLGESERRGAAVMAACAGAAARVQAQATSLLAQLRGLEEQYGEQEDVLSDLLDLDHRVSQMSRLADNIALLSGGRTGRRWTRPIVMESILRGAMGRIGAYRRVRLHSTSGAAVVGYAAEGVMHALAELMDNAATFSAHGTEVHVYVDEEDAGIVITIDDSGLGMRPRERQHATKLVSEPLDLRTLSGTRLGLAVVGRLVDKYGLTVSFRPSARGGTGVVMLIPRVLITQPRAAEPPAVPAQAPPVEELPTGDELLPRRRRGQTLAEATRARQTPEAKPVARDGRDSAARFAAFRQAGGRGRTSSPVADDA